MRRLLIVSAGLILAAGCGRAPRGSVVLSPLTAQGIRAYRQTALTRVKADYTAGYLTQWAARKAFGRINADCREAYDNR